MTGHEMGMFTHTTPLASSAHDPLISLASHCIRVAFGPSVQLVADALQTRGQAVSLGALIAYMKEKCPQPERRLGISMGQQPTDSAAVRLALLTLMRHGVVSAAYLKRTAAAKATPAKPTKGSNLVVVYRYHPKAARNLMRYARYVEFLRRAVDETAATVLQTLLLAGQMRTVDWITRVQLPKADYRYTTSQQVVESVYKLVTQGYVHTVQPPSVPDEDDDAGDEWQETPPHKRVRLDSTYTSGGAEDSNKDPTVIELLTGNAHYKASLPVDAVWKVNCDMFHDQLAAYTLGRLVSERFGSSVQSCGSMVTAALKFRAHQMHVTAALQGIAFEASSDLVSFQPTDCIKYLPKPVTQQLEKKTGGLKTNIHRAWEDIARLRHPPSVVQRSSDGSRYEINVQSLLDYLQERAVHQLIGDRHGDVAARVVSILRRLQWLESDPLADHAMAPARDTREVCHQMYRSRYIDLMQLATTRQHIPAHTIYLWGVDARRLRQKCTEDVATALLNIRIRRQHQNEVVGRHWLERERSLQVDDADENDNEADRVNYQKFKLGLERLDVAALQLDETLLLLKDYGPR